MAINWVGTGTQTGAPFTLGTPVNAPAISTNATGSAFFMFVIGFGGGLTFSVSDNQGNTANYVQQGTTSNDSADGISTAAFLCVNGAGGSNHIFSASASASVGGLNLYALEITGAATSSAVDQVNGCNTGFLGNPGSNSVTTTQAADLILGVLQNNSNTVTSFTPGSGFTTINSRTFDGSCLVGQVVSSTGTWDPDIGFAPSGGRNTLFTIAIKSLAGINTNIVPPVVNATVSGIASTVTPRQNNLITPYVARRRSGIVEPERRIFLPAWRRAA